ncbi:MAG TPA: single-stranded-DNA-specific exonuclease RecJ [Candidatus Gastranaerophilales bacterium]|nr:single-stranded-DNA-specific exonuclease RecJ [Candidatus Gastranaerophilales bacterium]
MTSCYKWTYKNKEINSELFAEIRQATGSGIIAGLLINRGITCPIKAKRFLDPANIELSSPYVFEDMQKAVDRINNAVKTQERIVIYGDFDADGVTSSSVLYKTLRFLGANAGYYIPDRTEEGHGLNKTALCKLISQEKAKLIITVDCGTSDVSEIKLAESLGTNVIVTDHHETKEEIPPAYAIINPKMLDNDPTGLKYLAGVGVIYKLANALLESNGKLDYIEELLPLVAIGTVGDVVPLLGENRLFVHKGLEIITRKKPASIAKILEIAGYKPNKSINSGIIAFGIVPRINAIGRLAGANPAVEFLVSDDDQEKINALAEELDRNNKERQQIGEETFIEAEEKIRREIDLDKEKSIILADPGWHAGIVGIVASKLVEKYHRPALLMSIDETKREVRCSARSIKGLNLFKTLSEFSERFIRFGGHSLAAGFAFSLDKISFEDLRSLIGSYINKVLDSEALKPELILDMDIEASDLTLDFIHELDKLAPYGEGNAYPVFGLSNLTFKSCFPMGAKKNHLKITFLDNRNNAIEAVWWQKGSLDLAPSEKVDIAFVPQINNFRDQQIIQLVLKDIRRVFDKDKEFSDCLLTEPEEELRFNEDELLIDGIDSISDDIKWVDHRQEKGFKREFLDYLKSLGDKISVFAESARAKEILENVTYLKEFIVDRLAIKKADCLVFLDLPGDDSVFVNTVKKADPKEIHFFGISSGYEPVELIKKISGMLKYAHNEKNGIVNVEKAASVLAIPSELFLACIELLDAAEIAEIHEITEDFIEFKFVGSVNLAFIQELDEYRSFLEAFKCFENYKNEYKNKDIELIKTTINNCCSLI